MTTILVIDDDPAIVRLLSLVLRSESFDVQRAFDGREGLTEIESDACNPDLIILDLSMPIMNGREFYVRAREAGYQGPVIVCSAFGATEAARELGAQAAVTKPFDTEVIVSIVNSQLHQPA